MASPKLAKEFDDLAAQIVPGFRPLEYRWAALNVRKKGSTVKLKAGEIDRLAWHKHVRFDVSALPPLAGVFTLFENDTCLFVSGTDNIEQSIVTHRRIGQIPLLGPDLWRPNPQRLFWQYAPMPGTTSDYRFGVVRSLVGQWDPIFNIPRGKQKEAA